MVLESFHLRKIGPFYTQIQFWPKRRVGHFNFSISLKNETGQASRFPVVKGIYSRGNRAQNIQGWFDIHYTDHANFGDGKPIILSQVDIFAEDMFRMIGSAVSPGGMLIVSYVTDIVSDIRSDLHKITRQCLGVSSLGVPPAATPLGRLLFISGCYNIKSDAFDVQGSSRLAGEKAPNAEIETQFSQKLILQLKEYLRREPQKKLIKFEEICRANAAYVLNQIEG